MCGAVSKTGIFGDGLTVIQNYGDYSVCSHQELVHPSAEGKHPSCYFFIIDSL